MQQCVETIPPERRIVAVLETIPHESIRSPEPKPDGAQRLVKIVAFLGERSRYHLSWGKIKIRFVAAGMCSVDSLGVE